MRRMTLPRRFHRLHRITPYQPIFPNRDVTLTMCSPLTDAPKANRQVSLCALHAVVSQHMSTLLHSSGSHILLLSTCSGQAFFIRAVISRSFDTLDLCRFVDARELHAALASSANRFRVAALGDMSHGIVCSAAQTSHAWNATIIDMSIRAIRA